MDEKSDDQSAPPTAERRIGPYRLLRELGRGGTSTVYEAADARNGRVVALKALAGASHLSDAEQNALVQRMEREARAIDLLSHPNIVRIVEVGSLGDTPETRIPYLAMEFLLGETLRARLDRAGAFSLPAAAAILDQMAAAVDAVHAAGVVHRDLKPGNIMLLPDGTAKLMDFGIARQSDDTMVTRQGMMIGSPAYMSPEQAAGQPATSAADQWALGVVLYEMVTGQPPFVGENVPATLHQVLYGTPQIVPASVPPAIRSVLARALERDPARRFPNAVALAGAFRGALFGATAVQKVGTESVARTRRPRAKVPFLVPVLALLLLMGAAAITLRSSSNRTAPLLVRVQSAKPHSSKPLQVANRSVMPRRTVVGSPSPAVPVASKPRPVAAATLPARKSIVHVSAPATIARVTATVAHLPARPLIVEVTPKPPKLILPPPVTFIPKPMTTESATPVAAPEATPTPARIAEGRATSNETAAASEPTTTPDQPAPPVAEATDDSTGLAGTWHGKYASNTATLIIDPNIPNDGHFTGSLTVKTNSGSYVVSVRGQLEDDGTIQFREESTVRSPPNRQWSLGASTGGIDPTGSMEGHGVDARQTPYDWSFHR
jgi:serine/threonine protein kinase